MIPNCLQGTPGSFTDPEVLFDTATHITNSINLEMIYFYPLKRIVFFYSKDLMNINLMKTKC